MNPLTLGIWEWFVVCIVLHFVWDVSKNILAIRRALRNHRRIERRKQDWTPREDPALWRKD